MKYSELKEKATQGEWNISGESCGMIQNAEGVVVCDVNKTATFLSDIKANARLIVHQHEHFDKLLEALESMLNNANTMPASICVPAANALNAAQTVKEQK